MMLPTSYVVVLPLETVMFTSCTACYSIVKHLLVRMPYKIILSCSSGTVTTRLSEENIAEVMKEGMTRKRHVS